MNERARWNRVEQLYHEALEREDAERSAFLQSACSGDETLRREVESLLGYDVNASGFLSRPAMAAAALNDAGDSTVSHGPAMSLAVGARLGVYEILAPVGAGGMGEVYRARDGRLGRDVAVKVLPGDVSSPERRKRFEREARAAGALNHPNVLTVYDVGAHEGVPYLVTELLEGETLRARLRDSGLTPREALSVAGQLATGLAAVHEKGIVHRDLKPENVFLIRDGRAKILDFGLAHVTGPHGIGLDAEAEMSRERLTASGVLVGTMAYMSPEQARGQGADARSDIFALGTVLYEMLTGRRAFDAATPSDVLSAILREEPPPIDAGAFGLAPALDRVVRRCLEKDPAQRFQAARDVAFALEALSAPMAAVPSPSSGPSTYPTTAAGRRRRPIAFALLACALVAGVAVVAFLAGQKTGEKPPPSFHRLTFRRGMACGARFAPDGQTIVYGAAWDGQSIRLYTTRTDSPESRSLDLPDADLMAVSSRGEMAVCLHRSVVLPRVGTLARASLAGGAPREVLERVSAADWSPDGRELAAVVLDPASRRRRLEFPVGRVLVEGFDIFSPRVSPRGDLVAFIDDDGVAIVDRAGRKRILAPRSWGGHGSSLAWSPKGDEIWYAAGLRDVGTHLSLHAVSLSGRRRLLASYPGWIALQDVSRDGRVLLTMGDLRRGIVSRPPGETRERDVSWLDFGWLRDFSRDGRMVLFGEDGEGAAGSPGIYLRRSDGSAPAVRLGEGRPTKLSPDLKWTLVFRGSGPLELVLLPTGPGEPKILQSNLTDLCWADFFPDGSRVWFNASEPGRRRRTYVQEIAGSVPRPVTPEGVEAVQLSPDGRFLIARTETDKLVLYPVEGGKPREVPGPPELGHLNQWAEDGHSLYVDDESGLPVKIFKRDLASGRREPWMEISPADPAGVFVFYALLAADGRSYAYSYTRLLSDLFLVEGLK